MKRLLHVIYLSLLCGLFFAANSVSAAEKGKGRQMPPAIVVATKVQEQNWQQKMQATGTLSADQGILVKSEVAGRVTHIYFKSGQFIKQGEPLIELDQSILTAQLQQNQAKLRLSELQFKRYTELYKKHFVSSADLDNARATFDADKANVAQIQAQLAQTLIKAPFSGKLGLKQVDLGDYVTAGQTIVNLQNTNPMQVDFSIPEVYLGKIAIGDTVLIRTASYPDQLFKGTLYAFDASIDSNTRTLAVRANVPNQNNKLIPGAFVNITLLLGQSKKLIEVPQIAIVSSLEGDFVYRVINGKAVKTPVTVQNRANQTATISNGLSKDDLVITDGQLKVPFDGAPVIAAPLPQAQGGVQTKTANHP